MIRVNTGVDERDKLSELKGSDRLYHWADYWPFKLEVAIALNLQG